MQLEGSLFELFKPKLEMRRRSMSNRARLVNLQWFKLENAKCPEQTC